MQNYLMINESTNVVDNVCVWDGNPNTWRPPSGYLLLAQATTMALVWVWDSAVSDWVLSQQLGAAQIGFTWDGRECVTNQQKPSPVPQSETQGAQTL